MSIPAKCNTPRPDQMTIFPAGELYRVASRGKRRLKPHIVRSLLEAFMSESGLDGWTGKLGVAHGVNRKHLPGGIDPQDCRLAGLCDFENRCIWITQWAIEHRTPAQLRDSILHEIAHALAGEEAGHDQAWVDTALELGMRSHAVLYVLMLRRR